MCVAVVCSRCGGATWSGCGEHVEQALAGVPRDRLCRCDGPEQQRPPLWRRLVGR